MINSFHKSSCITFINLNKNIFRKRNKKSSKTKKNMSSCSSAVALNAIKTECEETNLIKKNVTNVSITTSNKKSSGFSIDDLISNPTNHQTKKQRKSESDSSKYLLSPVSNTLASLEHTSCLSSSDQQGLSSFSPSSSSASSSPLSNTSCLSKSINDKMPFIDHNKSVCSPPVINNSPSSSLSSNYSSSSSSKLNFNQMPQQLVSPTSNFYNTNLQQQANMMWPQQQQQQHQQQQQFQQQMAACSNDPQLSALQFHLQREQAFNMLRNGARFFDPRFNMPLGPDSAAAAAAAAFFLQTAFRKPKRIRTAFTPSQLLKLENAFEGNHYVVGQERKDLAKSLNLTETQVSVIV